MIQTPKILTVSQLNFYLKTLIDNDQNLRFVFLEGEISNLTDHYSSGHIYFSLKDEKSVVRAVMFSYSAKNLKFTPQNGMKVIIRGRVSVYEPTGQYQLYVEDMQPDGVGALSLAFEQLKEKLEKEGLFSVEHKKPLPKFPSTIGVITSPTGAAVRDILNILGRRYPCADIVMCPVLVQGDNAPKQLTDAVNRFSQTGIADVIIIGRGGGSIEDLWAFNDEALAYAIYNCKTPIVSAVGHETDFTISDFVSDMRAPTPSAAAELVVPDSTQLLESLSAQRQYIDSLIDTKLLDAEQKISSCARLISAYSPSVVVDKYFSQLSSVADRMISLSDNYINTHEKNLTKTFSKVETLNPVSVLRRGFSFVTDSVGTVVNSTSDVNSGDTVNIKVSDGDIKAKVL